MATFRVHVSVPLGAVMVPLGAVMATVRVSVTPAFPMMAAFKAVLNQTK